MGIGTLPAFNSSSHLCDILILQNIITGLRGIICLKMLDCFDDQVGTPQEVRDSTGYACDVRVRTSAVMIIGTATWQP